MITKRRNPLKIDPTRTVTLRRHFCAQVRQRFAKFRYELTKMLVTEDSFGLVGYARLVKTTTNATQQYKFNTDPEKLRLFKLWLKRQIDTTITPPDQFWTKYAEAGWKKGAARAFDDVRKQPLGRSLDFYQGSRQEFLSSAFNQPVAIQKVQLLASRSFDDLENVTGDMSTRMTRTLADGLVRGDSPRDIADRMSDDIDISQERALTIARTEIIRAHAEGQLDALEELGVEEVGVAVEWSTTGDDKVCEKCNDLEGVVLKLDEAHGLLPRHPNCRCAWIPANVGEEGIGQKDTKSSIDHSLHDAGVDRTVSRSRPQAVVNEELLQRPSVLERFDELYDDYYPITNAFCPTGVGGGVNPHCSPGTHGVPVGHALTRVYRGVSYVVTATATGFNVTGPQGTTHHANISAAGTAIAGKRVSGWSFFGATNPKLAAAATAGAAAGTSAATPAATPTHAPPMSTIPYRDETDFETGKAQTGQVLNGIPLASAPPKFWEKTKDVDIKEPPALSKIDRVGIMIKEPDGRVWIVQPTNEFGNRKYTMPGGGVEKGLTNQQNALKETWEETGLQIKITGHLGDFKDSNNGNNGRLYIGERIGGAPWDAKVESHIIDRKTGKQAAESSAVTLVTPERARQLLHRTDDLAQLATVLPIDVKSKTNTNMMKKLLDGIQPAAQKYLDDTTKALNAAGVSSYDHRPGNQELYAAQELRGFNDKPKQVSKKEMDDLLAQGGHIEMLRGLSAAAGKTAKELADDFRNGTHYPGHGIFGSGSYADSNKGSSNVAASGQYGGSVIRIALPKDAKIIKASELESAVPNAPAEFKAYQNNGGKTSRKCWMGVQAVLAGYDAIHADNAKRGHRGYGDNFYVILNRGKIVVQKEDAKGHVIR